MRPGLSIVFRFALLDVEVGRCIRTYNGRDGGLLVGLLVGWLPDAEGMVDTKEEVMRRRLFEEFSSI
jgi:hypothetical protein